MIGKLTICGDQILKIDGFLNGAVFAPVSKN
jgi:hypothetical protein